MAGSRLRQFGSTRTRALKQRIEKAVFRPKGPESGTVKLVQRRVFILPTKAGLLLAAMLIALLLGSINYSLSLGFGLTFLMAGIGWVGMFQTFRTLIHLELAPGRASPVFAGEVAHYRVRLINSGRQPRYAITLQADSTLPLVDVDLPAASEADVSVPVTTQVRGLTPMPRITLTTTFPLGLWRAWSYWQPMLSALTYPAPGPAQVPLPLPEGQGRQAEGHAGRGSEDFAGIRPYAAGDLSRHLAWKAMARAPDDGLLTKTFDGAQSSELWLDLAETGHLQTEAALSRMTRWVLDCEQKDLRYGLRLGSTMIVPGRGEAHAARCLEQLALFGLPAP